MNVPCVNLRWDRRCRALAVEYFDTYGNYREEESKVCAARVFAAGADSYRWPGDYKFRKRVIETLRIMHPEFEWKEVF
jgi:hypothetical protein